MSAYYDPNNSHTKGQEDCHPCFFFVPGLRSLNLPAVGNTTLLEERKDAIATLASTAVDPLTRRRLVPLLQIIDLEASQEPLLLLDWVEQLLQICQQQQSEFPWAFVLRDGAAEVYMGPLNCDPVFEVLITEQNPQAAYQACSSRNEQTIAQAYLTGDLEIRGDLVKCLLCFQDLWSAQASSGKRWWGKSSSSTPPKSLSLCTKQERLQRQEQQPYSRWDTCLLLACENDFDLLSPGIFMYDEEDLEPAAQRKLAHAYEQLQLSKGATLLDIGCGYGGMMRYASQKGCHVTGITSCPSQADYVAGHLKMRYFSTASNVLCEDFYTYKPMFNTPLHNNNHGNNNTGLGNSSQRSYESTSVISTPSPFKTPTKSPPLYIHPTLPHSSQQQQHFHHHHHNVSPYRSSNANSTMETSLPSTTAGAGASAAGPMLFDAISLMGVLEELGNVTDYDKILARLTSFLKPGGRIYLDFAAECSSSGGGAASNRAFCQQYLSGPQPYCHWVHLPQWLAAIEKSSLVVDALWDNRHNYHLWALKCYHKLRAKQEDFLQQYAHQKQQKREQKHSNGEAATAASTHASATNSDTETGPLVMDGSHRDILGIPASTASATADGAKSTGQQEESTSRKDTDDDDDDGEFQYRLLLAMFAGMAASMVKQDYQCTAYRMVLKLPEGTMLG